MATAVGIGLSTYSIATCFFPSIIADDNVLLFSPCTTSINERALKCSSDTKAKIFQVLQYFGRPVDRIIQAVVAPFFNVASYISAIRDDEKRRNFGSMAMRIIFSPLAFPLLTIKGLIESVALLANGILQLLAPYQTVFAICGGKRGIAESNDLRSYITTKYLRVYFNFISHSKLPCAAPLTNYLDNNGYSGIIQYQPSSRKTEEYLRRIVYL